MAVCMKLNFRMKSVFRVQRSHIGELNARIEDSLLGHKVVKAFANEEIEKEKASAQIKQKRKDTANKIIFFIIKALIYPKQLSMQLQ